MFPCVLISKVCAVSLLFAGVHPVCNTLSWAVPTWVSISQRGEPAHGDSAHTQWWQWCWECGVYVLAESRMLWGKTLWYRVSEIYVQWKPLVVITVTVINCLCGSKSLGQNHSYKNAEMENKCAQGKHLWLKPPDSDNDNARSPNAP